MSREQSIKPPKVLAFRQKSHRYPLEIGSARESHGDVIRFPRRKAADSDSGMQAARQSGTIHITLLPDGTHQYVRGGAYASCRNLAIQALAEITADLATRGLEDERGPT